MAHYEQQLYIENTKTYFPQYFTNQKVLDCGSLDINGNNRHYFENCDYTGLDIGEGKNVDVVSPIHLFDAPDNSYDMIISTECFEHDMFYGLSIKNIIRLLKPHGMFLFTCATTGRPEHGNVNSDTIASPITSKSGAAWSSYYKNLTEKDIRKEVDIDSTFYMYEFSVVHPPRDANDLQFWGIKY